MLHRQMRQDLHSEWEGHGRCCIAQGSRDIGVGKMLETTVAFLFVIR